MATKSTLNSATTACPPDNICQQLAWITPFVSQFGEPWHTILGYVWLALGDGFFFALAVFVAFIAGGICVTIACILTCDIFGWDLSSRQGHRVLNSWIIPMALVALSFILQHWGEWTMYHVWMPCLTVFLCGFPTSLIAIATVQRICSIVECSRCKVKAEES
jgi:hypothetical protein